MEKMLTIDGMHCAHCTGAVTKALEALGASVQVSLEEGSARVVSDKEIPDDVLRAAVAAKGFKVVGILRK